MRKRIPSTSASRGCSLIKNSLMEFYFWISECTEPYLNLALEQDMMEYLSGDMAILYLWQNEDTIVVGRNQDIYSECKAQEFLDAGGRLARRYSGGGAVYHDSGNLNYSIISRTCKEECRYYELLERALVLVGIKADYNERNDLTVNGKKVSGNAVYERRGVVCQHGTILIDTNISRMEYFLTPDISKLSRNKVKSVGARVANLCDFHKDIKITDVRDSLIDATNAQPFEYSPDAEIVKSLTDFYKSDGWIFGGRR